MSPSNIRQPQKSQHWLHTTTQPSNGDFKGSSEETSLAPSWSESAPYGSPEDAGLSSFFDPWYCIGAEGNPLRTSLVEAIEATEQMLTKTNPIGRPTRIDMSARLENAYIAFLKFKKSRSAWQDIHGADPGLLTTAKDLLDRLQ